VGSNPTPSSSAAVKFSSAASPYPYESPVSQKKIFSTIKPYLECFGYAGFSLPFFALIAMVANTLYYQGYFGTQQTILLEFFSVADHLAWLRTSKILSLYVFVLILLICLGLDHKTLFAKDNKSLKASPIKHFLSKSFMITCVVSIISILFWDEINIPGSSVLIKSVFMGIFLSILLFTIYGITKKKFSSPAKYLGIAVGIISLLFPFYSHGREARQELNKAFAHNTLKPNCIVTFNKDSEAKPYRCIKKTEQGMIVVFVQSTPKNPTLEFEFLEQSALASIKFIAHAP
jgi:hypothetical protein